MLLAGAGFMMRSFLKLYRLDLGIETSHLLTMRLTLPNQKYPTPEHRQAFYDRLDERLAGLGGIQRRDDRDRTCRSAAAPGSCSSMDGPETGRASSRRR